MRSTRDWIVLLLYTMQIPAGYYTLWYTRKYRGNLHPFEGSDWVLATLFTIGVIGTTIMLWHDVLFPWVAT